MRNIIRKSYFIDRINMEVRYQIQKMRYQYMKINSKVISYSIY